MGVLLIVWPKLLFGGGAPSTFRQEVFSSRLLQRKVQYALHVPTEAAVARWREAHPHDRLRVVVFLPGAYDKPSDLSTKGLEDDLRQQEEAGTLAPSLWMAVEHFQSWYADRQDGSFPFEQFLIEEWLPSIERQFPAFGGAPEHRTVAGFSMGGFGALNLAARSHAFSRCAALSPALIEPPFNKGNWFIRWTLKRAFPSDEEAFAPWNPWRHMGGTCELILGCGTEDKYRLHVITERFAQRCEQQGRKVHLSITPGEHEWSYWRKAFAELAHQISMPAEERGITNTSTRSAAQ